MDKNAIKKYAVWARNELIEKVTQKAQQFEIEDGKKMDPNAASVNGIVLSDTQKKQRQALIQKIEQDGFSQVMEEVAYTWFNRFSALRFMEVNGYLPSHVRVFTDENNDFKPQILTEALHLNLDGLDMEKVYAMKNANQDEELFKYLLITQCNALNSILPGMFQKISDYTELLLPDYLLREGSVIEQMIAMIPEDDWTDQVQIIGWLYQYYNTEPKDQVFADLKKNKKITKEKIPAATQLFTPDWIVRYMVENSLGRLWLEGHPANKDKFLPTKEEQNQYSKTHEDDGKWYYYLEEAEQEPEVQKQLDDIHKEYSDLKPEDILCIDPCEGSGHILCYLFDALVKIYEDYGYSARDAASSIVEHNIWGLDIDERAAQLAYFSVMMKARQYDRRFFTRGVQPHVYAIHESNHIDSEAVKYFVNDDPKLKTAMDSIMSNLHDAKEYGSILNVTSVDFDLLDHRITECEGEISLYKNVVRDEIAPLIHVGQALAQKYHVVVTNPPYMGASGMSAKLTNFIKVHYPTEKMDLFSCSITKCVSSTMKNGFTAMITMESWMFLSSFEEFRKKLINNSTIINAIHMPYLGKGGTSLGINFGTVSYVLEKGRIHNYRGYYDYIRYFETDDDGIPKEFPVHNYREAVNSQENYERIPGFPIVYSANSRLMKIMQSKNRLSQYIDITGSQHITANNDLYLRCVWEPQPSEIGNRWITYSKGGAYRKWWGNIELLVDWSPSAQAFYENNKTSNMLKPEYRFREGITWTATTNNVFSARVLPATGLFDKKGPALFPKKHPDYILGLLNSSSIYYILKLFKEGADYQNIEIKRLPMVDVDQGVLENVEALVRENISICRWDWNERETSLEFKGLSKMLRGAGHLKEKTLGYLEFYKKQYNQLKQNESKINDIFAELYGLSDEVKSEVLPEEVGIKVPSELDVIKKVISFAIGCIMGRFDKYLPEHFLKDKDGIVPICDDEYFDDDVVGRFEEFIEKEYGPEFKQSNLKFISDKLGGNGSPREKIREYFMKDFYSDHCSLYSVVGAGKRPIYWLFDSGKKNGFKCLFYMHRYQPDTIARIRTDYVHEQQSRYRTAIEETEKRLQSADGTNKVKLSQKLKKLRDQDEELHAYEEKIHHLADQMISIDLDDGVKHNYAIFQDVLAKIK